MLVGLGPVTLLVFPSLLVRKFQASQLNESGSLRGFFLALSATELMHLYRAFLPDDELCTVLLLI